MTRRSTLTLAAVTAAVALFAAAFGAGRAFTGTTASAALFHPQLRDHNVLSDNATLEVAAAVAAAIGATVDPQTRAEAYQSPARFVTPFGNIQERPDRPFDGYQVVIVAIRRDGDGVIVSAYTKPTVNRGVLEGGGDNRQLARNVFQVPLSVTGTGWRVGDDFGCDLLRRFDSVCS